ncbi:MAG: hypothetical protein V4528_02700 [Pseudomonadota bacterium]
MTLFANVYILFKPIKQNFSVVFSSIAGAYLAACGNTQGLIQALLLFKNKTAMRNGRDFTLLELPRLHRSGEPRLTCLQPPFSFAVAERL